MHIPCYPQRHICTLVPPDANTMVPPEAYIYLGTRRSIYPGTPRAYTIEMFMMAAGLARRERKHEVNASENLAVEEKRSKNEATNQRCSR